MFKKNVVYSPTNIDVIHISEKLALLNEFIYERRYGKCVTI